MIRQWVAGVAGLLIVIGAAAAADKEVKGKLVSLDADGRKITVHSEGKDTEFGLNSRGVEVTVNGKESKDGLKDKALVKGAEVTLIIPATGKLVKGIEVESKKTAAAERPKAAAGDKPEKPKTAAGGDDKEVSGKLVSVDAADHKITIAEGGKHVEYPLNSRSLVVTVNDKESKDGLKDKALVRGAEVTLIIPLRGKLVKEIVIEEKKAASSGRTTSLKPKEPTTGDDTEKPKTGAGTTEKPRTASTEKPKTSGAKPDFKGTPGTVVSVDVAKMLLIVKVEGKNVELTISEGTKFIGPRGGNRGTGEKGPKDDVLAPGAEIHFVKAGKQVEEIHLPVRKSSDK